MERPVRIVCILPDRSLFPVVKEVGFFRAIHIIVDGYLCDFIIQVGVALCCYFVLPVFKAFVFISFEGQRRSARCFVVPLSEEAISVVVGVGNGFSARSCLFDYVSVCVIGIVCFIAKCTDLMQ